MHGVPGLSNRDKLWESEIVRFQFGQGLRARDDVHIRGDQLVGGEVVALPDDDLPDRLNVQPAQLSYRVFSKTVHLPAIGLVHH